MILKRALLEMEISDVELLGFHVLLLLRIFGLKNRPESTLEATVSTRFSKASKVRDQLGACVAHSTLSVGLEVVICCHESLLICIYRIASIPDVTELCTPKNHREQRI